MNTRSADMKKAQPSSCLAKGGKTIPVCRSGFGLLGNGCGSDLSIFGGVM